jgi:8-oxo-dGTP pyrophosphatase MutT (NUDIX family)
LLHGAAGALSPESLQNFSVVWANGGNSDVVLRRHSRAGVPELRRRRFDVGATLNGSPDRLPERVRGNPGPLRVPFAELAPLLVDVVTSRRPPRAEGNTRSSSPAGNGSPQALSVAIAVVQRDGAVLLVQRRDDGALRWQFPAGIVKPGASPSGSAVRETFAETDVHCSVAEKIGTRVHPKTGVYCEYLHCDYLAGEAENRDVVENASVAWVPIANLTKFIPESTIYPPILEVLGGTHV